MIGAGQVILEGRGSAGELRRILSRHSPRKIFLVTAGESFRTSTAERTVLPILRSYGYVRFCDFAPNPRLEDVAAGVNVFRTEQCDYVVGIGGGSVIDLAKAVSILVDQPAGPEQYLTNEAGFTPRRIGSIMVPTTAGSGSESTHFSVVYINSVKHSLAHLSMLPDYAILDATLTDSVPPRLTACSGLDALSQAVESFWSVKSTEASRALSVRGLVMVLENLAGATHHPDEQARDNMLKAANLAGQAINIARTTAAHGASYYLTTHHHVPHGHAVALILPHLVAFNGYAEPEQVSDKRGPEFVTERMGELLDVLQVDSPEAARRKLIALVADLGLETRLSQCGVGSDGITAMAVTAVASDRVAHNPVMIRKEDMQSILRAAR